MSNCVLKKGDRLRVHGWIMLQGVDEGDYVVDSVHNKYGFPVAQLRKPQGKKIVACHPVDKLMLWNNPKDNNYVEIIGRA